MRVVTSKTLLTAVAGLIAIPGAAIAAADPDAALLELGAAEEEVDCEEYADDLDAEIPEECLPSDEDDDGGESPGEEEDDDEQNGEGDAEEGEESENDDEQTAEGDAGLDEGDEEVGEAPGVEDVDDGQADAQHGRIVSTVAHCAPRGQERLEGFDLANHGAYVSTAAQGGVLNVTAGDFDLSSLDGAEGLCAAIEQARTAAADDDAEAASTLDEPAPSEQRGGAGNGNDKGKGATQQGDGPGRSGSAPGRNR